MFFCPANISELPGVRPSDARNLDELYEEADRASDWADPATYEELAPALARGPSYLHPILSQVFEQIKAALEGKGSLSSANSFVLKRHDNYTCRVNFWRPARSALEFRPDEVRMYAYGLPHDHDFDLLTVGLIGPGYRTSLFRYSGPPSTARIPFDIDSSVMGELDVGRGDVLYMQRNRDIHVQFPPKQPSMTLNIMSAYGTDRHGQFVFDNEATQAIAIPENYSARLIGLIEVLLATQSQWLVPELIAGVRGGLDRWLASQVNALLEVVDAEGGRDLAKFWRDECAKNLPLVVV